jgi:iron complex outermembrane recepter protein
LGRITSILLGASSALVLTAGLPAVAQQADQATAANSDQLEEIVVTARRVEEREQATPISVTAVSADRLKSLDITRVNGIATVTPNLMISDAPSNGLGTIVYIRGIGQISVSSYADPPIAIYVDGIVQPRPVGNAFDLPDVDRVEVLRGPQGTLFGRNTTGGAIAIYTKKPTQDFGGTVTFGYGDYNEIESAIVLNTGELGDSGVLSKFTYQHHGYDGWLKAPGVDSAGYGGYYRSDSGSFSLSKSFGDNFTADNRLFIDQVGSKPAYQFVLSSPATTAYFGQSAAHGGPPFIVSSSPLNTTYFDPRRRYDPFAQAFGDTLNLAYEVNDYLTLKSITGYRHLTQKQSGQLGGSDVVGFAVNPANPAMPVQSVEFVTPNDSVNQDQQSQEFQATGAIGDFNYVGGLYYFHESIAESLHTIFGAVVSPDAAFLVDGTNTYAVDSTSYAGYANLGYKPAFLDEKFELSTGIRYTADELSEDTKDVSNGVLSGPFSDSHTWENIGWNVSLSYKWTPDIMTYFRASSGYRSGGFNPGQVGSPAFAPEKAKAIEAGVKSELFDHHLRLNVDAFKTFYDNLQIGQYNLQSSALSGEIVNAGKATYTGFEVEGEAVLGGGFQLNATVGYVDPQYQQYLGVDSTGHQVNLANVARFVFVSRLTYNVGGSYKSPPTNLGVFTVVANYAFQSSHFFNALDAESPNNASNPSGDSKNLTASITLGELPISTGALKNVKIQLHGENLTDNRYRLSFIDFGTFGTASYNRPRSFGARFDADF